MKPIKVSIKKLKDKGYISVRTNQQAAKRTRTIMLSNPGKQAKTGLKDDAMEYLVHRESIGEVWVEANKVTKDDMKWGPKKRPVSH